MWFAWRSRVAAGGVAGLVVGEGALGEREDAEEFGAELVGADAGGRDGVAPDLAAVGPDDDGPLLVVSCLPGVEVGVDLAAVVELDVDLGAVLGLEHLVSGHVVEGATGVRHVRTRPECHGTW